MKRKIYRAIVALGLIGVSLSGYYYATQYVNELNLAAMNESMQELPSAAGPAQAPTDNFEVFDGTQFKDTTSWLGDKVKLVYENQLLGQADNYMRGPDEALIKQVLSNYKTQARLVLVLQSWNIIRNNQLDPMADKHAQWFVQVMRWAREALPATNLGLVLAPSELSSDLDAELMRQIEAGNTQGGAVVFWSVLEKLDSLYPAFDVSYNDFEQQIASMSATLSVAKSLNKPVYPLMWHRGSGGAFKGKLLPDDIIAQQCKFVRSHADGVLWWSGATETWDGGVWYPAASECFRQ